MSNRPTRLRIVSAESKLMPQPAVAELSPKWRHLTHLRRLGVVMLGSLTILGIVFIVRNQPPSQPPVVETPVVKTVPIVEVPRQAVRKVFTVSFDEMPIGWLTNPESVLTLELLQKPQVYQEPGPEAREVTNTEPPSFTKVPVTGKTQPKYEDPPEKKFEIPSPLRKREPDKPKPSPEETVAPRDK